MLVLADKARAFSANDNLFQAKRLALCLDLTSYEGVRFIQILNKTRRGPYSQNLENSQLRSI